MKPLPSATASIALGGDSGAGRVPHRFSHAAMATVFEVHCAHDDPGYARQAAHAAFGLVDRLEQEMSRFIPNSDVSRINGLRAGQSTRVSPSTLECLEIARHLFDLTGGAFDVSIGTGLDRLELVPDDFTVQAHADGVRLDLGGIGKGYAVDGMAEALEEWEVHQALVHGGFSSVRALGPPPGRDGWPLTLSAPGPGVQGVLARIEARQLALSASGTQKGDHIWAGTGRAVRARAAWTAVTARPEGPAQPPARLTPPKPSAVSPRPSATPQVGSAIPPKPATLAEGLSTAFMILPSQDIEGLCRRWPEVEAWLLCGPAPLVHMAAASPGPGPGQGQGPAVI